MSEKDVLAFVIDDNAAMRRSLENLYFVWAESRGVPFGSGVSGCSTSMSSPVLAVAAGCASSPSCRTRPSCGPSSLVPAAGAPLRRLAPPHPPGVIG
jgi:hypothetical protein